MRLYLSSFRNGNRPEELLRLLGDGRRTAVIHNAADAVSPDERKSKVLDEADRLKSIGLKPTEIDLREYFGKSEELRTRLGEFDLLWVRGGNCFVLRRAFKMSGADRIVTDLLTENKIVFGGYSAGIDMLTPSLRGADLVDDATAVPVGYETEVIWDGLNLVPYAIAPHYKSDHPESADIDRSVEYLIDNHILFIALRDGEAIVVNGDEQFIAG